MHYQKGNSFECATLLVSLLLGKGYNAFVVSGYASKEQVECDRTRRACPYLPKPLEKITMPLSISKEETRYALKPPPVLKSRFLQKLEEEKKRKVEEEQQKREEEMQKAIMESEKPPPDKYHGYRIHGWVVVLPEPRGREVNEPFFIEPSTGDSYLPTDPDTNLLYLGVESIWNDRNYWVNMQTCLRACKDINWNLTKTEFWEHVLPGEPRCTKLGNDDHEEDDNINQYKHLDMPFSYVDKIELHSLDYERRYPNGNKTIYFKKCKVELHSPYGQTNGLVERVTEYEDYEYKTPSYIHESFLNRLDHFVKSTKNLVTESVVDYYSRGRPDACKEHHYSINCTNATNEERTLEFYDCARFDGISRIKMQPQSMTQTFVGRQDFLQSRYVEYAMEQGYIDQNGMYRYPIVKIIEKFGRNEKVPASKNIEIREIAVEVNEIRLKYHYEKGCYSRATRTFVKSPTIEEEKPIFDPKLTHGYNPDPLILPDETLDLFYEFHRQVEEEKHSIANIREAEDIVAKFLKTKVDEKMTKLTVSIFDRNRNEDAQKAMLAQEEISRIQSQREVEEQIDYLAPYFARLGNPVMLKRDEALKVQEECIKDFKRTVLAKASRVKAEFEKHSKELDMLQTVLKQNEDMTKEEKRQMHSKMNMITSHMHTLETRFQQYQNSVQKRYEVLLQACENHPSLSVLYTR